MHGFAIAELDPAAAAELRNDLLAIADSKLVLGNWYAQCIHNGRSLPDFAALLAMTAGSYGHSRSLYLYLVDFGHDYAAIERGRPAADICAMDLLDAPPRSWEDFIASTYLAEQAIWMLLSGFLRHPDRALSGLAEKMGQETYFHLKFAEGWMKVFAESGARRFAEALSERYPLALRWFGPGGAEDNLLGAGLRNVSVAKLKETFAGEVAKVRDVFEAPVELAAEADFAGDWRLERRRTGVISDRLYEVIRFRDPEAAHP